MPRSKKAKSVKGRLVKAGRPVASMKGNGAGTESAAITTLAEKYKAFKVEHPGRAARVPGGIKDEARRLHNAGATYSGLADACGITQDSVRSWIEREKDKPAAKPGRKPGRPSKGANLAGASVKGGWVKIRVEGREVEVAKADFWDLLKGGIESGM